MDVRIKKIVIFFLVFLKIDIKENLVDSIVQFVKFGLVGVTNTVISYVLNVLVLAILSPLAVSWDFVAGNAVAFVLSVLWSFYWNNRFVFSVQEGEKRNVWKALLKTYVAYAFTGIVLNNLLSWVWISALHISKYVAPLINLIISVPVNFIINKLWAFKTSK